MRASALFILLIALHVLPVWVFRHFPSQDGPEHMSNARLLLLYGDSDSRRIREYYEINTVPYPTWLGQLVLAGLIKVVRDAALAEKLVLTGYLVFLPLAARRALAAIGPEGNASAFLIFPLLCTYTFHMGFFTFSYSLAVFFLFLSVFVRCWPAFGARETGALTGLALLLFCCHVVAFGLAFLAVVALTLFRFAAARPVSFPRSGWRPLLAFLPGALWAAALVPLQRRFVLEPRPGWSPRAFFDSLSSLVSYRRDELPFYWAMAVLVIALALAVGWRKLRERRRSPWDAFIAVWAVFLLAVWKTPSHVGLIWLLPERVALFAFFGAILWLSSEPLGRAARTVCMTGSIVLSLGLLVLHVQAYRQFDVLLGEYDEASRFIPDDSVVLPLTFAPQGSASGDGAESERVAPFRHAAARIGWTRSVVELANYQARLPVFPLRFRERLDPYAQIGPIEALPARLDVATYPARTGGTVDSLVVWGLTAELVVLGTEDTRALQAQIDEGFVLVHTSEKGHLRVYRRREKF